MLSAEDDSSSSESEEYCGNSFESMRDLSLELPSSSSTNPCLPLLQENRDECHSVSPTSSNSQRGRLVRQKKIDASDEKNKFMNSFSSNKSFLSVEWRQ